MNVYPIYGPIYYFPATLRPLPFASTTNHSLLVVVYWYPFFTFLIPTRLLLFLFNHFVTPLLPYTIQTFFVLSTAFLFAHREFVSYRFFGKKTHTHKL